MVASGRWCSALAAHSPGGADPMPCKCWNAVFRSSDTSAVVVKNTGSRLVWRLHAQSTMEQIASPQAVQAPQQPSGEAPQAQLPADGARPAAAQLHMHAGAFCDDLHNAVSAACRQLQLPPRLRRLPLVACCRAARALSHTQSTP